MSGARAHNITHRIIRNVLLLSSWALACHLHNCFHFCFHFRGCCLAGALFEFPNTVDGRVIRLVGVQASCSAWPLARRKDMSPWWTAALIQTPMLVANLEPPTFLLTQVFVIALLLAVFSYKKEQSWHWVAVGLLVDFCLRFYAGAGISPLGSVAMMSAAAIDLVLPRLGIKTAPVWGAGGRRLPAAVACPAST